MCKTHFFDSGRKCVAMVMAYYGKNGGKILRRELLPQFFTNSHEIWHRCLPWGVDVKDTFFGQWQKVCCHGNGILCQQLRGESIFKLNLAHMLALKCRCVGHSLGQWQNVCCHGYGILFQKLKNKTYCDAMNNCAGRGY